MNMKVFRSLFISKGRTIKLWESTEQNGDIFKLPTLFVATGNKQPPWNNYPVFNSFQTWALIRRFN